MCVMAAMVNYSYYKGSRFAMTQNGVMEFGEIYNNICKSALFHFVWQKLLEDHYLNRLRVSSHDALEHTRSSSVMSRHISALHYVSM